MRKKATFQLSVNFIVIIVICLVIFIFSIFFIKNFFTHATDLKDLWDERTQSEIEKILDDGSRVALPFDKKTIIAGEFDTFGVGILNVMDNYNPANFRAEFKFNKAFDKADNPICIGPSDCGPPDTWLQTTDGKGIAHQGITVEKNIKAFEQSKFLLGVLPKDADKGIYIFNLNVSFYDGTGYQPYDNIHKLYVEVP
jgi:hypothetical protein